LSNRKGYSITRFFANLKVRPKLMVLHNLFFLVLTCAAYFSLIPLFEKLVSDARSREISMMHQTPRSASEVRLSEESDRSAVLRARLTLFLVLGSIYVFAVLVLEVAIMPLYVYRPLKKMLDADAATQAGDRERELIPGEEIFGDEIGQIMSSRNATVAELRRQEDELAAALRRLEDQDRLVSLGLLSASVAHELNTPLAVLNGSIEKLIETTSAQASASSEAAHALERLQRMQRVAQRLQRISESLVGFSKVRTQQMEPLAVRTLIDESWGLVAIDEKSSSVEFVNSVGAEDRVIGNADRLVQVFVNLLRNALNAIENSSGRIEVRSRKQGRRVMITVEDNGKGIRPDVLPDIFDAFVTTRLDARGTGLGLTVAAGIVTQHNGTISASNRADGGARLEVSLPAARA